MLAILIYLMSWSSYCPVDSSPLPRRIVDMTYTFDESTLNFPTVKKFNMDVVMNGTSQNGIWYQAEEYSSGTHVGTHMDAPAHFAMGGLAVDQIPVSRLIGPAAVVDITAKAELDPDAEVTVEDLLRWESVTGQSLNETILLMRSGWGNRWNNRTAYFGTPDLDPRKLHSPGFSEGAARWLVDHRNILGVGVDTLSLDKGSAHDYIAHQILQGHGIYGLENVANMEKIPIYGAMLYVTPMKIGRASGAPTGIIATYPEVIFDHYF